LARCWNHSSVSRQRFESEAEGSASRGTPVKGRWSKMEPILTILLVVTKCMLHGGDKMDCLHLRHCSLNALGLANSASTFTLNATCRRLPSPGPSTCLSLTRYSSKKRAAKSAENSFPRFFWWEYSMRCSQIARYRFRDLLLWPSRSISTTASATNRPQLQVFRMGLFHDEPPL
jgi:hypothetical protein